MSINFKFKYIMKKFFYLLSSIAVILLITVACEKSSFDDSSIESAQSKESLQGKSDDCNTIQSGLITGSDGNVIETGYDEWGYNYNANMFNGFYCDSYRDADWCQEYKDVELIMKWNDAWLSNKDCGTQGEDQGEFTALTPDGRLDRHYGFPSYRGSGAWITNHQKGVYEGEDYNWDVSGNWLLDFAGGTDNREFVNLVQDAEGNVIGEFWYYDGTWIYGGTLVGIVTGDNLHLDYDRNPIDYTGVFDGIIGENEITAGTFSDSHGNNLTWTATGTSEKIYETCEWDYFIKIVAAPADAISEGGIWYNADGTKIGAAIWGDFAIIQEVYNDPCSGIEGKQYGSPVGPGLGKF
ncbi:MAG: hypothetical protein ACYCZ2_13915 [Lutibacter sp.]